MNNKKCDRCNKDATIEIIISLGDKDEKLNMCFDCYSEIINESADKSSGLQDYKFFNDILSDLLGSVIEEKASNEIDSTIVCEKCNHSLKDIIENGKFGCENCYTTFYDNVKQILQSTHGSQEHVGIHPERFNEFNDIRVELQSKKSELENLVLKEDYESAAKLRDEITKLSDKLTSIESDYHE